MSWNYRIVKKDGCYGIHEVYYKDNNAMKTKMVSVNPMDPHGETIGKLKSDFELMKGAFDKPTLDYKDIGSGGKEE